MLMQAETQRMATIVADIDDNADMIGVALRNASRRVLESPGDPRMRIAKLVHLEVYSQNLRRMTTQTGLLAAIRD